jgi:hypothetical protein
MSLPSQAAHSLPLASQPLAGFASNPNMSAPTETIDLTGSAPDPPNEDTTARRTSQGTKRKSTSNIEEEDVDLSDIDIDGMPITENADQVRRKIARLIENDGMKVGEFCDKISVSSNAYYRFVHQHGPTKGLQSDTFMNASAYFKKREIAGLKLPTAASKKAKTAASKKSGAGGDGDDPKDDPKKPAKGKGGSDPADFLQVHLDGEETDSVPIYDTCADVRRKISAHLRDPGVTQAQFCRDLHSQLHGPERGAKIQSTQLARFRAMSGPNQGGDNKIFYAGYVFFEKKRIAEGKPKSKKRQEMEEQWPGGVDRTYFGRLA